MKVRCVYQDGEKFLHAPVAQITALAFEVLYFAQVEAGKMTYVEPTQTLDGNNETGLTQHPVVALFVHDAMVWYDPVAFPLYWEQKQQAQQSKTKPA